MKTRTRKVQIIALVLSVLMLLNIPLPVLAEAAIENAIEEAQKPAGAHRGQADGNRDILAKRRRIGYIRTTPGNPFGIRTKRETGTRSSTILCRWTRAQKAPMLSKRNRMITARNRPKIGCCLRAVCLRRTPSRCKMGNALYISARYEPCPCRRQNRKQRWSQPRKPRHRCSRQKHRSSPRKIPHRKKHHSLRMNC